MRHPRFPAATAAATVAISLLAVSGASAHVGLAPHAHGFLDGAVHPLTGLDHVGAMLAVGLWSATLGGIAMVAVPVAFVALLIVGALLGTSGVPLPEVETVVTASVIVMGLLVATKTTIPLVPAAVVTGLFGLFHGYAHGMEMPMTAHPYAYGLGFVVTTALLHAAGIGVACGLDRTRWVDATRWCGGVLAGFGVLLVAIG